MSWHFLPHTMPFSAEKYKCLCKDLYPFSNKRFVGSTYYNNRNKELDTIFWYSDDSKTQLLMLWFQQPRIFWLISLIQAKKMIYVLLLIITWNYDTVNLPNNISGGGSIRYACHSWFNAPHRTSKNCLRASNIFRRSKGAVLFDIQQMVTCKSKICIVSNIHNTLQQLCVKRHVEFIHFPDIREYWKFTTKSLLKSLIVLRRLNISMEYQVLKKKMRTTEVKQKAKLTPYFKMTEKIAKRTKKMVKKRKKKFRLTHSELSESEEFKDNVWWVCWVMNRILYSFPVYQIFS